jgi:hypothetical protein
VRGKEFSHEESGEKDHGVKADVVIKPKVGHIGSADFWRKHGAMLEGEKVVIEALPQITAIVTQLRQEGRLE